MGQAYSAGLTVTDSINELAAVGVAVKAAGTEAPAVGVADDESS